jgi:Holliday junction resolvase RusA-like endonuclease
MKVFIVYHEPIGQPRHRISTFGKHARMYLPATHPIHAFKRAIQAEFGISMPFHEAVAVTVNAWFSRPKAKTWKTKPMPAYRHIKKPDADNVLKAVLDALNGLAWIDDAQVFSATVRKFVCAGNDVPRCEISISGVSENE